MGSQIPRICQQQFRCSEKQGIDVGSVQDILNRGIYITNAVKTPKTEYAVSKESIEDSLSYLEKELAFISQRQSYHAYGGCGKESL